MRRLPADFFGELLIFLDGFFQGLHVVSQLHICEESTPNKASTALQDDLIWLPNNVSVASVSSSADHSQTDEDVV